MINFTEKTVEHFEEASIRTIRWKHLESLFPLSYTTTYTSTTLKSSRLQVV